MNKKALTYCLAATLILTLSSIALGTSLKITLKDGTVVYYEIDDIAQMEFIEDAASGQQAPIVVPPAAGAGQTIRPAEMVAVSKSFNGPLDPFWTQVGAAGGNFQKFAKLENGQLNIDVPSGNSWGKTGIMSSEPLFTITKGMAQDPVKILIELDPSGTDGFVIALNPVRDTDAWNRTNLWGFWGKVAGTNKSHFGLTSYQGEGDYRANSEKEGRAVPQFLLLTIWPGKAELKDPVSGETFTANYSWLKEGVQPYFFIFSSPLAASGPSKLAVKSIEVFGAAKVAEFSTNPAPLKGFEGAPDINMQFEGTQLDPYWSKIAVVGGNFDKFAKISGGKLSINVSSGNSWGKTGVVSKAPVFTVETGMASNPARILLEFDPSETENFVAALAPTMYPDVWLTTNTWISWVKKPGTEISSFVLASPQGEGAPTTEAEKAGRKNPQHMSITVYPGKVEVKDLVSGETLVGNYSWMKAGTPVYFYLFSSPYIEGGPAKFSLKSFKVFGLGKQEAVEGGMETDVLADAGITGTPAMIEEFEEPLSSLWDKIEVVGGNFNKFAKVANGELTIDVPSGNSWGKTGILSAFPMLTVESGMSTRPARILVEFNQQLTENVLLALSEIKNPDVWLTTNVWANYMKKPGSADTNFILVSSQGEGAPTDKATRSDRPIPKYLMLTIWPGKVEFKDLDTKETLTANYPWIKVGTPIYFYAFVHPWEMGGPAKMSIKSIKIYK